MPTLADYYVQIIPSAEGISNELTKVMDNEAGEAGNSASNSFSSKFSTGVKKAAKVGAAAISAASTAVSGFAAKSVSAGMDFDASMSQVAATMGKTVDEIQDLRDFAQQMGSTTAFSATESADALNYMALAGYDAQTSMQMLPNVLNLAAAGGIALGSASDMVTDAQSALGLSIEETATMVDQMAAASSKSNTSVSQLGEAILTIGATAKGMAGGTQELSTVLGALADNGIKGAEGGTHLRNMLLSLQNPTDQASETLEALGIAVYDSQGNMRSMIDIIGDLQTATADMTQEEKDFTTSGIFNKTDLAAVNALLNTSTERFEELGNAIGDSQGAAEAMANTQLDNLNGDITLFKSALEGAEIALSDTLTPTLREFVQFGSSGLEQLTTAFNEGGISGAMDALGNILSDALNMIIEKLPQIVEAGSGLLGSLTEGIINNLPAIAEVAMTIITNLASGLAESLPTMIPTITSIILQLVDIIIQNLPTIINAGMQLFEGLITGLIEAIPLIIEALPNLINSIVDILINFGPDILDGATTMFLAIVDALPDVLIQLTQALPEIIDKIVDFMTGESSRDLFEAGVMLFMEIVAALPEILGSLLGALGSIMSSLLNGIGKYATSMLTQGTMLMMKLGSGLIQAGAKVLTDVTNTVLKWINGVKNTLNKWKEAGANLLAGLWNGISDKAKWVYDQITNLGGTILKKLQSALHEESPSKATEQMGIYLAEGLEIGWTKEIAKVNDKIGKDINYKGNIELGTSFDDSALTKLNDVTTVAKGKIAAVSSNNNSSLDGMKLTIEETIDLGDTELKRIVSDYTIKRIGSDLRAVKVARGGNNVL